MGRWVSMSEGGGADFSGYLCVPPSGKGPGLLLIQEIWGVNAHIRAMADNYAAEGFVVLAPDIFWRQQPGIDLVYDDAGTELAYKHYNALDMYQACDDLGRAVEFLKNCEFVEGRLGVLGYCLGGTLAYSLAANEHLSAGVSYYGSGIGGMLNKTPRMAFPFLFHFAGDDHLITLEEVNRLKPLLSATGDATFRIHEGQRHGFNCVERNSYSMRAALLAKGDTLRFFAQHLVR
ncbi:dienelactone hydrolase family protein [Pseudomonas retamae]|uniref:Dienelactone hydrolase family protein n=1 Tax=Pseudomonas retamae TaxID=702110 RepID=A0ABW7DDH9_9PSED